MTKKKLLNKVSNIVLMLVGVIALIGVGGLFVDGAFLNVVILNWLPLIVHQVVGWIIVVGALFSGIVSFMK